MCNKKVEKKTNIFLLSEIDLLWLFWRLSSNSFWLLSSKRSKQARDSGTQCMYKLSYVIPNLLLLPLNLQVSAFLNLDPTAQ